jgi:uncharacterized Zn finger protein
MSSSGETWRDLWLGLLDDRLGADRRGAGRRLFEQGRVHDVEPRPGGVSARVSVGRSGESVVADLAVPTFGADQVDSVVGAVAADPRLSAEVVTGGLPVALARSGGSNGPGLLPSGDRLVGECGCGEWADACDHVAALGWWIAEQIVADPFVILLLRGVGHEEFVGAVRARRGGAPPVGEPRDPDQGVDGGEAYRRTPSELPRHPPLPWRPSEPTGLGVGPPADSGIDGTALVELVGDVARRAVDLLHTVGGSGLDLTAEEDLVRRAAGLDDPARLEVSARLLGWSLDELRVATAAWQVGGVDAVRVQRDRWDAPAERLAEGAAAVEEALGLTGRRARVAANVVSGPGLQLRLDRRGRWWRFRPDDELGWVVTTEGFDDPAEAADRN